MPSESSPQRRGGRGGSRRGAGRPPAQPERGVAAVKVTVRLYRDEVVELRRMGKDTLSEAIRCLIASDRINAALNMSDTIKRDEPVEHAAISHRVPVVPRATRLPRSITSWSDDE